MAAGDDPIWSTAGAAGGDLSGSASDAPGWPGLPGGED